MTDSTPMFAQALADALGNELCQHSVTERLDELLADCMALCTNEQLNTVVVAVFAKDVPVNQSRWKLPVFASEPSEEAGNSLHRTVVELGKIIGLETFSQLAHLDVHDPLPLCKIAGDLFHSQYKGSSAAELIAYLTCVDPMLTPRQYNQFMRHTALFVIPDLPLETVWSMNIELIEHGFNAVIEALNDLVASTGDPQPLYRVCWLTHSTLTPAQQDRIAACRSALKAA